MPSASLAADLLAADAQRRMLGDPITFLRAAGIELDPWQAEVMGCDDRQVLLNCSRQAGKSMITSGVVMFQSLTVPKSKSLLISKAERQAFNLLAAGVEIYRNMGRPIAALKENSEELRLSNGSWIGAMPGKSETVRSISGLDIIAIDEAAFVPDELYMSVRPMRATRQGRLFAMSSPFGMRGWFWDAWYACEEAQRKGLPEPWRRFSVTADDCPRISPEFLAGERRDMGEYWFLQEYYCKFLDAVTQLFGTEYVRAAMRPEVEQWDLPPLPTYEPPRRGQTTWALPALPQIG